MSLDHFSTIADVVGALGVVLSLLYVARQLKQANDAARAAAQQALVAQGAAFALSVATLPDLSTAFAKVHFQNLVREGASETERIQLGYAITAALGPIYLAYQQMKEGVITREEAEAVLRPQGSVFYETVPQFCLAHTA